ncbi:MAG: hypothetical protein O2800_04875 [Planctomycetota bacterium]|nr:hypothetical protein [Planctomycetota bacterium]
MNQQPSISLRPVATRRRWIRPVLYAIIAVTIGLLFEMDARQKSTNRIERAESEATRLIQEFSTSPDQVPSMLARAIPMLRDAAVDALRDCGASDATTPLVFQVVSPSEPLAMACPPPESAQIGIEFRRSTTACFVLWLRENDQSEQLTPVGYCRALD